MKLKTRAPDSEPEINLISLIDVILMLVIFFMMSSQFVNEGRVRIQLPNASAVPSTKPDTGPIIVTVTQPGGYRVNEQELINSSPETLRAALIKIAGADRTARITVRADARTTHQSVITAMDVLGRLGFTEINIATVKEEARAGKP